MVLQWCDSLCGASEIDSSIEFHGLLLALFRLNVIGIDYAPLDCSTVVSWIFTIRCWCLFQSYNWLFVVSATAAPEKRIRFKTTTDASETQVIEAMQKIASHIKNPAKFSKASKLAIQLIQAGSVNAGTSIHFFAILEAAMSSPTSCNDASVRADYHALFSAAQETVDVSC